MDKGNNMAERTSLITKTGKTRLGPLNMSQLEKLLNSTSAPKEKARIQSRIRQLQPMQK